MGLGIVGCGIDGVEVSSRPSCSVCIANYNGEEYLSECIKSVYGQFGHHEIEIIIHDDASSDGSVNLIKEKFPDVSLIISKENVGFCKSNNRMVERARGTYVLLLNNDAVLFPDAIMTLINLSATYGNGIFGLPQYDAETGILIDRGSLFDPFLNPIPNLDQKRGDVGMIIGACLWIPRSLWLELGGFPEWFETLAEDMYLCCVARLQGYSVKCSMKSGFYHWVGQSLGGGKVLKEKKLSTSMWRRSKSERNKTYVMIISYPSLMVLIIPIHIILLFIEGIFLSAIEKDKRIFIHIYMNSVKSVWHRKNLLLKYRCRIQKKRKISIISYLKVFSIIPHKLRMLVRYGVPKISIG